MTRFIAISFCLLLAATGWAQPEPDTAVGRPVPKVVGLPQDEAEEKLKGLDLPYTLIKSPSLAPNKRVFKQVPSPGGSLKEGKSISLFVTYPSPKAQVQPAEKKTIAKAKEPVQESNWQTLMIGFLVFQVLAVLVLRKVLKRPPTEAEGDFIFERLESPVEK